MSARFVALGFCALDALATLMTFIQGSATLCLIIISLAVSLVLTCCSWLMQSLVQPTYFWDEIPRGSSNIYKISNKQAGR